MKKLKKILSFIGGFIAATAVLSRTSALDIRVILLGKSDVGKTSLIQRGLSGRSEACPLPTLGVKFYEKPLTDKDGAAISFVDTEGQERYAKSLPGVFVRGAEIAVFVVSKEDADLSYDSLDREFKYVKDNTISKDVKFVLVGNKTDLSDSDAMKKRGGFNKVVKDIAKKLAENNEGITEVPCFFTSTVTGEGVNHLFDNICDMAKQFFVCTNISEPTISFACNNTNESIDRSSCTDTSESTDHNEPIDSSINSGQQITVITPQNLCDLVTPEESKSICCACLLV